jgi:hypothetical protein
MKKNGHETFMEPPPQPKEKKKVDVPFSVLASSIHIKLSPHQRGTSWLGEKFVVSRNFKN